MFVFLTIFALFNEFSNIFFYIFEVAVSLNYFNNIRYPSIPILNWVVVLSNTILNSFYKNLQLFSNNGIFFLLIFLDGIEVTRTPMGYPERLAIVLSYL